MARCERCNVTFKKREAEEYFDDEMWGTLEYRNIKPCLCGVCAVEAIRDQEEDIYFETCEKCGKYFDLFKEEQIYAKNFPWYNGTILRDEWKEQILCAECALEKVEEETDDQDEFEDEDNDGESLSVYDAADIWASHGKDEDYMFGFSKEELEDAL